MEISKNRDLNSPLFVQIVDLIIKGTVVQPEGRGVILADSGIIFQECAKRRETWMEEEAQEECQLEI